MHFLAHAGQVAAPPTPVQARGRRPTSSIPAERQRHLLTLALRTVCEWPIETIRRHMGLTSRRTVHFWAARAALYPEASTRERLIEASGLYAVLAALAQTN